MKSVERLVTEHDLIERGLNLLEKSVVLIESDQPVPDEFPKWAAGFFAEFADKCHHAKEEDLFFPLLKEKGIPAEGGPIGVMLHEHDVGRDCVGRMREAGKFDAFDSAQFAAAANEFVPLLRQHIFKENNILFQMAGNVMSDADDANMDANFTKIEQLRDLAGLHERYESEIVAWEEELK